MTVDDLVHAAVVILSIAILLAATLRGLRALRTSEDSRLADKFFISTPSMPQLVIALKYLKMILTSWEYVILLLFLILLSQAMTTAVELPIATIDLSGRGSGPVGTSSGRAFTVVYSAEGFSLSYLKRSPELAVFVTALEEPVVVKLDNKILRAFSLIIIECGAGYEEIGGLEATCERPAVAYSSRERLLPPEGPQASVGTIYLGELEAKARIYVEDLSFLRPLTGIPRIGALLNATVEAARAVGALILINPGEPLRKAVEGYEDKPRLVLLDDVFLGDRGAVEGLFEGGASEIYTQDREGRAAIYYVRRDPLEEIRSSVLAGLAAGLAMVLFNRSVMPKILRSAEAVTISGSTNWVSRTIPILSLIFSELLAAAVMTASYLAPYGGPQGRGLWESFVGPPGFLLASTLMIAISSAHAGSFRGVQGPFVEKGVASRVFNVSVGGLGPEQVLNLISRCFDDSEFFVVLERETLEGKESSSARFRLIYTYSIGVGVDVEIYISRVEGGSLVEIEAVPWSIDESRSGYMESIARLALSRIVGVIVAERTSGAGL